jgi:hypothetical protein
MQARRHDNLGYRYIFRSSRTRGSLDFPRQSYHEQAVGGPGCNGQPERVQQIGQAVRRGIAGRLARQQHIVGNQVARVDDSRALAVEEIEVIGELPAFPGRVRRGQPENSSESQRRQTGSCRPHGAILEQAWRAANVRYRSMMIRSTWMR